MIMKRTLRLLLTVGLSLVCVSLFAQKFPNYPIPQQPDTLRILGIGNSFTDDGMMYLPELLEAAGIRNVVLGRLYIAGCSLERHCREYAGNAPAYIYYKSTSNRWETVSKKATLLDGIADERWDVVVLQQASGKSGIYPTYQPGSAGWSRSCDGVAPMPEPASPGNRHGPMPAIRSTGISDDTRRTSN